MKTRYLLLGLMSVAMLSACGKSMQLTKAAPPAGPTANNQSPPGVVTEQITPPSTTDLADIKKIGLPFVNPSATPNPSGAPNNAAAVVSEPSSTSVGKPNFTLSTDKGQDGFVKNSNVTLRSLNQVPADPKAISDIRSLTLTLSGVRLYVDGSLNLSPAQVLANQVVCVLDHKTCFGGKLDPSVDSNVNKSFATGATFNPLSLASFADFTSLGQDPNNANGTIYAYNGSANTTNAASDVAAATAAPSAAPSSAPVGPQLVIDLKAALGLSDADLAAWVVANSKVYDTTGNYRKFRFVLANNIYASAGTLLYQYDLDPKWKKPANWNQAIGAPVGGKNDVSLLAGGQANVIKNKINPKTNAIEIALKVNDQGISFDDTASSSTLTEEEDLPKLKILADELNQDQASIDFITIDDRMDIGSNSDATVNVNLAKARALAIQTALVTMNVKSTIKIGHTWVAKTSGCAPQNLCGQDRYVGIKIDLLPSLATPQATTVQNNINAALGKAFNAQSTTGNPADDSGATTPATAPNTSAAPASSIAPPSAPAPSAPAAQPTGSQASAAPAASVSDPANGATGP